MNTMEWLPALAGTFWLGLQTAICPCPLATNIAAISYIGRRMNRPRETIFSGILYAGGQILSYLVLSFVVLVVPIYSGDQLTRFFTSTLHVAIGPIMILVGMVLSGLIDFPIPVTNGEKIKMMVDRFGLWSSFPLGVLFALAFCPTTAAMFLTMLMFSAQAGSVFIFPLTFGLGMSLPVVFFAILLAFQVRWLGNSFHVLERTERIIRPSVGVLFILLGIWFTARTSLGLA